MAAGEACSHGSDFLNWQRTLGVDLSPAASQVAVASAAIVAESESVAAVTNNGALRLAAVDLAIAIDNTASPMSFFFVGSHFPCSLQDIRRSHDYRRRCEDRTFCIGCLK